MASVLSSQPHPPANVAEVAARLGRSDRTLPIGLWFWEIDRVFLLLVTGADLDWA
jgi:hypothetical protein